MKERMDEEKRKEKEEAIRVAAEIKAKRDAEIAEAKR